MAFGLNIYNNFNANKDYTKYGVNFSGLQNRPENYVADNKDTDRLRKSGILTKTKINIQNFLNTPGYAYRGLKGDPDFNFFEQQKVSRIPYYLGGIGLAAICLAGKSKYNIADAAATKKLFKKVLAGVIFYYVARELANLAIDLPVRIFRGVDLNMPYRKVTSLREGNHKNLPNIKKPSNQSVFESTEFTRWDLLYEYGENAKTNAKFDKMAKKFGIKNKLNDSDSKLIPALRKLMIMSASWKYMLSVPYIITALGLAQQDIERTFDFKSMYNDTCALFKKSSNLNFRQKFILWRTSIYSNTVGIIVDRFKQLWKGKSLSSKILGRSAIIAAAGTTVLANAMILSKTSLKNDNPKGGQQ